MPSTPEFYLGLMSGTSLDGIDAVLVEFAGERIAARAHASSPLPASLRAELLALNAPCGVDELHRSALAANALARQYASLVEAVLTDACVPASAVRAIGAHGQTVRHRPSEFDDVGYTLQLNSPALLAELSGIDVVADFRSRDLAAGGQGAPLVPAFHRAVFGQSGKRLAVLNLGGIANLSILPAPDDADGDVILGFDCGPANALLDHWCQQHLGQAFDEGGRWASSGQVLHGLLDRMLADAYFERMPPKSTGRDLFNPEWLTGHLQACSAPVRAQDVQATLAELTAVSVLRDLHRHGGNAVELIVCGGGAFNKHLLSRIAAHRSGVQVLTSSERGLPPTQVEAAAFAWLARATIRRESGNLPSVTGARGPRVLGAIYPA
ncbi:anhydro-N-acetylmuramic acid kinase [Variovorax dokdonensis]|uniref:Anhydro-N-acetylmuramic acid kinase n=1 Tax=Variovorax dokdonensis TaxID=344883 RepID=A0ABT7N509_9BURK|nr:anhydro-N-acetylmuramic acid kinase [Variovorax dokdonensis]MDM0043015.1 anhydro-N-acetylmuramic acid kinase [Variovorax dokdonensis]